MQAEYQFPPPVLERPNEGAHFLAFAAAVASFIFVVHVVGLGLGQFMSPPPPLEVQDVTDAQAVEVAHRTEFPVAMPTRRRQAILEAMGIELVWGGPAVPVPAEVIDRDFDLLANYGRAVDRVYDHARLLAGVAAALALGLAGKHVGYPLRHVWLLAVPVVQYVFISQILWRFTSRSRYWE